MTTPFFTIIKNYFRCSCCCCFEKKKEEPKNSQPSYILNGDNSPFSFDDLSNPSTPITLSSSSSSLDDSFNRTYKRQQFKPYVGIIPANYYSD